MHRFLTVLATTTVAAGAVLGAATASGASLPSATTAARPAAEHIPSAVHRVHITYEATTTTPTHSSGNGGAVSLHGAKASRLVTLFDALKREPRGTLHCDVAGGPTTTVTFRGPHHTWVATQAACTNLLVTRDGKSLPTLVPSKAWASAVSADLKS